MFSYLNLLEPTLIKQTEAQEANNCNITEGFLCFKQYECSSNYLKEAKIYGRTFKVEDSILKRSDGTTAGMKVPASPPELLVGNEGSLSGEYSYFYTIADDYIESAPSKPSSITVSGSEVIISGFDVPDEKARYIRIYRLSPGATDYLLVAQIPTSQDSYTDNLNEDQLGVACNSYDNYPPPSSSKYLLALHDKLFLSVGNKLYFSKTGVPEAFPPEFFIQFDGDITGLAVANEVLLIFTESKIYSLYGNDETDFVLKISNAIVGALHNSVQDIGSRAIFVSKDGVYITNGVEAVKISEKIEPLFPFNPVESSFDGRFYVVNDGNKKIVYDTVINGFCTSDDSDFFSWRSKEFTSRSPIWQLKQIQVNFEGNLKIEVFRDGELMTKLSVNSPRRTQKSLYVKGLRGNRFSVRFVGDKNTKVYNYALVRA